MKGSSTHTPVCERHAKELEDAGIELIDVAWGLCVSCREEEDGDIY